MIKAQVIENFTSLDDRNKIIRFVVTCDTSSLRKLACDNEFRVIMDDFNDIHNVPFETLLSSVQHTPFIPLVFPPSLEDGDQEKQKIRDLKTEELWVQICSFAKSYAKSMRMTGIDSQICNRLLEPFAYGRATITLSGDEIENFFENECPQYEIYAGPEDTEDFLCEGRSWKDFQACNKGLAGDFDTTNLGERFKYNKKQGDVHMMLLAEVMWDAMNEYKSKES